MQINDVPIEDTFAEAFPMTAARLVVTAETPNWALTAAQASTGFASSVIGCDCEAGIERWLGPDDTPDGRPGVSLLFFGFSREALQKALINRVGQSILTCATTACYNGLPLVPGKNLRLGGNLRFFGDGWQQSKFLEGHRYWRLPTMDGEFVCEDWIGSQKGVGGGNFLLLAADQKTGLYAAELAVEAMRKVPGIIMPFPGGVVRSGSKVGSKYKKLKASTNDAYCPTLRGLVPSKLPEGVNAVYEIVIDGLDETSIQRAMNVGIRAACRPGILMVTAGNYGGTLGPVHLHLHRILEQNPV